MNLAAPVVVVVRLRLDERVKRIDYLPIAHNDNANAAHAAPLIIGRLKSYCCKVLHLFILFILVPHSFDLSGHLLAKPEGFQHFHVLAVP